MLAAAAAAAASLAAPPPATAAEEVRIVRDGYGVPHVFAGSTDAVAYGAGYALAQDRLWQMHVLRRIAKGRLSDIVGTSVLDMDREVRFFTYTEAERARRVATYPDAIQRGLRAFVDGINAWIAEAGRDSSKMPLEFAELGETPIEPWTLDDTVALQDVLILAFGSGGGSELQHAALLRRLTERLGPERGRLAFDDLVRTTDRDTPVTIPHRLRWRRTSTHAREDEVAARRRLEPDARLSLAGAPEQAARASSRPAVGTAAQLALVPDPAAALRDVEPLERGRRMLGATIRFGSNAQIVGPDLAAAGNSLQTAGPQVGYTVPQLLVDIGLHGGGLDATGMTFAGAGPAVLIGRGPGYAWTTTTGASDLTDTYAVRLNPENPREYLHDGRYEPMDCRTETYTVRGVAFESEEICRTRHGPAVSIDEGNHVAYAVRYAWFNREGQTVEGFLGFNTVRSLRDFGTFASFLASNHNMFYADDRGHFGYWHPGNHPVRPPGTDLRLPQDGSGGAEWTGVLPNRKVPHAVDFERGWLVNWNNQPAKGWQRERGHPARDNVVDLHAAYRDRRIADPFGGLVNADGRWSFQDLNANLRHAAFKDHRYTYFLSALPERERLASDQARRALDVVRAWDGFLLDENRDGAYDSAGVTILREWLAELRTRVFDDDLTDQELPFARIDSELWHVVSPDSRDDLAYDWLGGADPRAVAAEAFEAAVARMAERSDSGDPATGRTGAELEPYQRLNSDLPADLLATMACDDLREIAGSCAPAEPAADTGLPGDVPDHVAMDRGTYNHIVVYERPPQRRGRGLGLVPAEAGSVIPPGQSGFTNVFGQEARHYHDQLPLYVHWRYKPMPLTLSELGPAVESTTLLSYGE